MFTVGRLTHAPSNSRADTCKVADQRRRLDSLTSLRWFATLAVFAWHIPGGSTSHLARIGPLGVSFFFVLSGFVLVWSHRAGDTTLKFWRRRLARLYPLHLAALGAAAVVMVVWEHGHLAPMSLLAALPLVQAWSPHANIYFGINYVDWSLSCEVAFYTLFPLLLLAIDRWDRRMILTGAVASIVLLDAFAMIARPHAAPSAMAGRDWLVYICPLGRLPEFVIGMVLARELQHGRAWSPGLRTSVGTLLAALAIVTVAPTPYDLAALTVVPIGALIVAVAQAECAGGIGWLRRPGLVQLGTWSFAFYLFHQIVLRLLVAEGGASIGWSLVVLGVALIVAGVTHWAIERPAEAWLSGRHTEATWIQDSVGNKKASDSSVQVVPLS